MEIPTDPQSPEEERLRMDMATSSRIMEDIEANRPLIIDQEECNRLIQQFSDPDYINPTLATKSFADSLSSRDPNKTNHDLVWADLDLLRPCLGTEHITAVLGGIEVDYAPLFYDSPLALQIMRTTALLQDGGKVLCVNQTGNNFEQEKYNTLVSRNITESLPETILSTPAKRAINLLIEYGDIVGGILQDKPVDELITDLQAAWPTELEEYRDDLMLIAYLSDASAHSNFRLYDNYRQSRLEPAVRPEDQQLSFLFESHQNGAVTLTEERCQKLLQRFPGLNRTRHLLEGNWSPLPWAADVLATIITEKLTTFGEEGEDIWRNNGKDDFGGNLRVYLLQKGRYATSADYDRYHDRTEYFTPGDGRVWAHWQRNHYVFPMIGIMMQDTYVPKDLFDHSNPQIAAMQQQYYEGRKTQAENMGHPLSEKQAWSVIHEIQSHF